MYTTNQLFKDGKTHTQWFNMGVNMKIKRRAKMNKDMRMKISFFSVFHQK